MVLQINGIDMSPYVKFNGITRGTVKRNTKTRIAISGKVYRSSVSKLYLQIAFEPLTESQLKRLVLLVEKEYISVTYKDPVLGLITKVFLPDVADTKLVMEDHEGVSYWSNFSISLEEQ